MNYHGPPYGQHYVDPSSYGRTLPRPTSSGTLENDAKRQKVERPYHAEPYYVQPYAQPAPYYPQTHLYAGSWNRGYYPGNAAYVPAPAQAQAPAQVQVPAPVQASSEAAVQLPATQPARCASEHGDSEEESGDEADDARRSAQDETNGSTISGTSITLATDEDIAKWREERKKMWLLKISNRRQEHMQRMGVKEDDLKRRSVLQESKKQKQFIQSIQNQVSRANPRANLNVKIVQREMAQENCQLLDFIQQLGDAQLLEYELTPEEKVKLFGPPEDKLKSHPHAAKKSYIRKRPAT